MNNPDVPSPNELRRLLRGELDAGRARELYHRLAESDEALSLAEGIWAEESPLAAEDLPSLSDRRSARIERRLFGRVHRTHLAEDLTELSSGAFLYVVLGLLSAVFSIFGPGEPTHPAERRTS